MMPCSSAYQKSIPKPIKANGIKWLELKYAATKTALENFRAYITHQDELKQTDSKSENQAQIKGWLIQWKEFNLLIHMSILLDVVGQVRRLTFALQTKNHGPGKQVCRIHDFTQAMTKLQMSIENTLDEEDKPTTYYKWSPKIKYHSEGNVKTADAIGLQDLTERHSKELAFPH